MTIILDRNGQERSWAWLQERFGLVSHVESAEYSAYRLLVIQEQQGHSSLIATLIDEEANPIEGIEVIRYWPDAPELPYWEPPPERWFPKGVHGRTNADGNMGFAMGHGDLYDPAIQSGASSIWVGEPGYGSDCISGLGWIVHPVDGDLHLNVVFQRLEDEPPPPVDDFETKVLRKMDWQVNLLKRIAVAVEG